MAYEAIISGIGTIVKIQKPLDQALIQMDRDKRTSISMRDLAYSRKLRGLHHSLSSQESYVQEGIFSLPDKTLISRVSPLLKISEAKKAVKAHSQGSRYYCEDLAQRQLEIAEEDLSKPIEKRRVFIDYRKGQFNVPVKDLHKDGFFYFLLLDQTKPYQEFLMKQKSISEVPVYFPEFDGRPSGNQLSLGRLKNNSSIEGSSKILSFLPTFRGIKSEKVKTQKQKYSFEEISIALNESDFPEEFKKTLLDKLRK